MIACTEIQNVERNWRLLAILVRAVALLLALSCLSASVSAQSTARLRQTGSAPSKSISRDLPKRTSLSPQTRSANPQSKSATLGPTVEGTHSIVQPAAYEELIIPNALAGQSTEIESNSSLGSGQRLEDGSSMACDVGSESCSMYDYIASNKRQGSHYFLLDWSRADLWLGTTSFVNPASVFTNAGGTAIGQIEGAFGFQEGFNFGSQLPSIFSGQLGSQFGMRFVQSNLDGSSLTNASRNQMFLTAGLFRRVDYGFQGGAVVDYFHQQWIERVDLLQLRAELSFLFSPVHELGFRLTENGRNSLESVRIPSSGTTVTTRMQTLDTYRLFARRRFGACSASMAEAQLGTSNNGGVVLGLLLQNPLSGQLGLESSATYFVPKHSATRQFDNQAWSMSISLVWTPGRAFGTCRDYNRPLFEVAGNSSLIQSRP